MKKIDKRILLFFFCVLFLFWGAFSLIESRPFAHFLGNQISVLLKKRAPVRVNFDRIGIELFPLGVSLYDVDLNNNQFHLKRMGLSVGIKSLLYREIEIHSIVLEEGTLNIPDSSNEDNKNLSIDVIQQFFNKYITDNTNTNSAGDFLYKILDKNLNFDVKKISILKFYINYKNIKAVLPNTEFKISPKELSLETQIKLKQNQSKTKHINLLLKAKEFFEIQKFEILAEDQRVSLEGKIQLNVRDIKNSRLDISGKGHFDFLKILKELKVDEDLLSLKSGVMDLSSAIDGTMVNPRASITTKVKNFNCKWSSFDDLVLTALINKKGVLVQSLKIYDRQGELSLLDPFTLYHFDQKKLLPSPIRVKVKNFNTYTIFHELLDGDLDPWKAYLTGEVQLDYRPPYLLILSHGPVLMKNFDLFFKKSNLSFIKQDVSNLKDVFVKVKLVKETAVNFSGNIEFQGVNAEVIGDINKKNLLVTAFSTQFDFEKLGPLGGKVFTGIGPMSLKFHGDFDKEIVMDIEGKLKNATLMDYYLGKIDAKGSLHFRDISLVIQELRGQIENSTYFASGVLGFEKDQINLEVNHPVSNLSDIATAYRPLVEKIPYFPKKLVGNGEVSYHLSGGFDISKLKVEGQAFFKNIVLYGESFSTGLTEFVFDKNIFMARNVILKKEKGEFKGNFDYNYLTKQKNYEFNLNNWDLQLIRAYKKWGSPLNGLLKGTLVGHQRDLKNDIKMTLTLTHGHIQGINPKDSLFSMTIRDQEVQVQGDLFGDLLKFEALIDNTPYSSKKNSYVNLDVNCTDLPFLFLVLGFEGLKDVGKKGVIRGSGRFSFPGIDWRRMDARMSFDDFLVFDNDVLLDHEEGPKIIRIKNGEVIQWNISTQGHGGRLRSMAEGPLYSHFKLESYLDIDAFILESLFSKVISSSGQIKNTLLVIGDGDSWSLSAESKSNGLSLVYANMPGAFENIKYDFVMDNKQLYVKNLEGYFANGPFKVEGNINYSEKNPLMNFSYKLDNANLTFFDKTYAIVSGSGFLSGSSAPYILSGNFLLSKGFIGDEFSRMAEGRRDVKVTHKFIPTIEKEGLSNMIQLDLKFDLLDSLQLKNSMVDLLFGGHLEAEGTFLNPRVEGIVSPILDKNKGKFFFKNNEFKILKGQVLFNKNDNDINPDIQFEGRSHVGNYDVVLNVQGKINNPAIEFSASPYLSQQDIFSLLTLGFTGDISQGLSATERNRQYLSSAGGMLLDKVGLNENLKSSLGLNVSVTSDVSQSEMKGVDTPEMAYKAGTKINVTRRLGPKVDISASNTIGGDSSNKQEVNINYQVNKRVYLDGVYELKNDDVSKTGTTNSVGADVKFKWTFK